MSLEQELGVSEPVPVIGEVDAGRAAQVKKLVTKLIKQTSELTFDIAELLYEVQSKNFFREWGFDTFVQYVKSLQQFKTTKGYYLVKIVSTMNAIGFTREQYEPLGVAKLRAITRIDPAGEYNGVPMTQIIKELTLKAADMSSEEVTLEVEKILGKTEDDTMVWLNLRVKKSVRDAVIKVAIARAKKFAPQQVDPADPEQFIDVSDGVAVELICANFLADPNFADTDEEPPIEEVTVNANQLVDGFVNDGVGGNLVDGE